jgi:hypothetical protein
MTSTSGQKESWKKLKLVIDMRDLMPLFRVEPVIPPISPKQLEIIECKVQFACDLNFIWHSRFPRIDWSNVVRNKDYVCYIAIHDGIVYAVAIWSSPIAANRMKNGSTALELRRLAIAPDAPRNTASRMISLMRKKIKKKMPHIKLLISYQDTDVHLGTIYKASGWTQGSVSKAGIDWNGARKRSHAQSTASKIRWEICV